MLRPILRLVPSRPTRPVLHLRDRTLFDISTCIRSEHPRGQPLFHSESVHVTSCVIRGVAFWYLAVVNLSRIRWVHPVLPWYVAKNAPVQATTQAFYNMIYHGNINRHHPPIPWYEALKQARRRGAKGERGELR